MKNIILHLVEPKMSHGGICWDIWESFGEQKTLFLDVKANAQHTRLC